jgi:SAM-dependent methyltransferase
MALAIGLAILEACTGKDEQIPETAGFSCDVLGVATGDTNLVIKGLNEISEVSDNYHPLLKHIRKASGDTPNDLTYPEVGEYLCDVACKDYEELTQDGLFPYCASQDFRFFRAAEYVVADAKRAVNNIELPATPQKPSLPLLTADQLPEVTRDVIAAKGMSVDDAPTFQRQLAALYAEHHDKVTRGGLEAIVDYEVAEGIKDVTQFPWALYDDVDGQRLQILTRYLEQYLPEGTAISDQNAVQVALVNLHNAAGTEFNTQSDALRKMNPIAITMEDRGLRTHTRVDLSTFPMAHLLQLRDELYPQMVTDVQTQGAVAAPETAGIADDKAKATPVRRVLIVGPGLEFIHPDLGNEIPMQMYEPYALVSTLLESGLSNLDDLQVDLMDINPDTIAHVEGVKQKVERGDTVRLHLPLDARYGNSQPSEIPDPVMRYASMFGTGFQAENDEEVRYPIMLGQAGVRDLVVPPKVVETFNPVYGDVTTHALPKDKYDLVIMFNVLTYMDDREQALAVGNIAQSLRPGGVYLTDQLSIQYSEQPLAFLSDHFISAAAPTQIKGAEAADGPTKQARGGYVTTLYKPVDGEIRQAIDMPGSMEVDYLR